MAMTIKGDFYGVKESNIDLRIIPQDLQEKNLSFFYLF